jgi:hypothetical protein
MATEKNMYEGGTENSNISPLAGPLQYCKCFFVKNYYHYHNQSLEMVPLIYLFSDAKEPKTYFSGKKYRRIL